MIRIGRLLRQLVWGLVGFVLIYAVAAVLGGVVPARHIALDGSERDTRIGLVAGPIHYDLLLPIDAQTRAALGFEDVPVLVDGAEWLVVGWGSAAFYTTAGSYADVAPGAVLRAVTGDDAVMRFDVFGPIPAETDAVIWVDVSPVQVAALHAAILDSLVMQEGRPVPVAVEGFTPTDRFFRAHGRFHLFRTCNVWISDVLRQAGVQMGIWTPLPYSVTLSLKLHAG